jgi:diamine N-acetyltransferase
MKIEIIEKKQFSLIDSLVEEVQNLHATLFPAVYKQYEKNGIKEAMEKMLADEQTRVFVAQLNGETIAYILLMIKEIPENAFHYSFKLLHIDQIVVAKNHQKSGVGAMLMDKAEMLAKELSINRLELDHLHLNIVAANFFRRKAYKPYREKLYKLLD